MALQGKEGAWRRQEEVDLLPVPTLLSIPSLCLWGFPLSGSARIVAKDWYMTERGDGLSGKQKKSKSIPIHLDTEGNLTDLLPAAASPDLAKC